jgi:HEAT repeat protein
MSRRVLLRAVVLLGAVLTGTLVLPDLRWVAWGRLRGEAVYRWRPTSYWSALLRQAYQDPWDGNWYVPPRDRPRWMDRAEDLLHVRLRGGPEPEVLAEGPAAMPVLVELLADEDSEVRRAAASYLGRLGPRAGGAALALGRSLKDPDALVGEEACGALARMGPAAEPALPAFRGALRDEDGKSPFVVLLAIEDIAKESDAAVPVLAAALTNDNEAVRLRAASALGRLGPRAAPAVPALTRALQDPDERVRRSAAEALRKAGPAAQARKQTDPQAAAEAGTP